MLLSEINPHIRFAKKICVTKLGLDTITYDSRMFYVHAGECNLSISGKEYHLKSGVFMLWKCGTPYKFTVSRALSLFVINFDYTRINSKNKEMIPTSTVHKFNKEKLSENINFTDFDALNTPIILSGMQMFEPKFNMIENEFCCKKLGYEAICSAIMKELITETVRVMLLNTPKNIWKVENIIKYIEQNYERDISNAELSEIAGYHPYHLSRLVKSATGMSLHQYILNARLEKAKDFLLNTELSVYEIADKCGFKSPYHFSNTFKMKNKLTPTEFRNSKYSL